MAAIELPLNETTAPIGGRFGFTNSRDRRRAATTVPRLAPGRYLAIEDGDEVVVVALGEQQLRLGRSSSADVMLEHLSVSRRHAVVAQRGERTVILDDRSRNGVLVNGERVREAALRHNDEILLGDVAIRFLHVA